jgi:hypothetical protein
MSARMVAWILLSGMLASSLCGCGTKYVYVESRIPVYDVPERPTLANVSNEEFGKISTTARQDIVENFNKLIEDDKSLRAVLKTHNEWASNQNIKNGYGSPVVDVQKKDSVWWAK